MNADIPAPWLTDYRAAREAINCGNIGDGIRILSALITLYPSKVLFYWVLGYALLDSGSPKEAVRRFKEAVILDPTCYPAWGGLGHAYEELEKWDLAEKAYRTSVALHVVGVLSRTARARRTLARMASGRAFQR